MPINDACRGATHLCRKLTSHVVHLYTYELKRGGDGVRRIGAYCEEFADSLRPSYRIERIKPSRRSKRLTAELVALTLSGT